MSRPTPCTPRFHQVRRKRLFPSFPVSTDQSARLHAVSNAAANASPFLLDPWIMPYPGRQGRIHAVDECLAASRGLAPSPGPRRKPHTPNLWFKAEFIEDQPFKLAEPFIMRLPASQTHTSVDTLNLPTPARHHPPCSSKTSRSQPDGVANTTHLGPADDTMSKSYACLPLTSAATRPEAAGRPQGDAGSAP